MIPLRKLITLILLLAFIGGACAWLLYSQWYVLEVQERRIEFQVTEGQHIGFNIETDRLVFGKVPQAGGAERRVTLSSPVPANAHITIHNTTWVTPSVSRMTFAPNEQQQVLFSLEVPKNATPGNYSGKVRVVYTRRFS